MVRRKKNERFERALDDLDRVWQSQADLRSRQEQIAALQQPPPALPHLINSSPGTKPYDVYNMMQAIDRLQRAFGAAGAQIGEAATNMTKKSPIIRAAAAPTVLRRRRAKCPEHNRVMVFRPDDALWHCTSDGCQHTAYQVADKLGGEPRKPQVVREHLDFIVAQTDDGERTYLRCKKLGLLIDITEQLRTLDYNEERLHPASNAYRTQAQIVMDSQVTYVDYR